MGDPTLNPYAPSRVIITRKDEPFLFYKPFNVTTYKCYESSGVGYITILLNCLFYLSCLSY